MSHHGLLVQIKGDWEFLANKVGLPSWSATAICAWCRAAQDNWKLLQNRECVGRWSLSSEDYFGRLRGEGKAVCPLFAAPAVTRDTVCIDWMHTVDQGVSQDLQGGALWVLVARGPGPNQKARLRDLFLSLQEFYKEQRSPSVLDNLTLEMFKTRGSPAKLKSKAHECRCLLPFTAREVERMWRSEPNDPILQHLHRALASLWELQEMSTTRPFPAEEAKRAVDRISNSWGHLEDLDPDIFRVKPKLHLLQHLVGQVAAVHGAPSMYWCYLEEDWGGRMVRLAKVWGRTPKVGKFVQRVFQKALALLLV